LVVKIAADHGDNGASKVKSYQRRRKRKKSINLAIVSANNHYAGFGPGTANIFRKMVGLPEAVWSKDEDKDKNETNGDSVARYPSEQPFTAHT
jgi:hypothetical protein